MASFHRGDFNRLRRNLTVALLEAEVMEPRILLAFSQGLIPAEVAADMGLVRLLLERADRLTRGALDRAIGDTEKYYNVYADSTYTDRRLVDSP